MKIALPLAMTAMIGLAGLSGVALAATPAVSPATAQPTSQKAIHEACTKEADAKHLVDKARHEFMKTCTESKESAAKNK